MKIDVAICTWNRARLLVDTLRSVSSVYIPDGSSVRVIVVNNNSTDNTTELAGEFAATITNDSEMSAHFSIELVQETQQGHSFSRNRAVEIADGDLMLWTDDDVIVDTNWVTAYMEAAENENECFWGGQISPVFESDQPDWIKENWDNLKGCFAERDLGDQSCSFTNERLPYGANFAIRTEIQKKFLYDTELGRRESAALGEDELNLFRRLLDAGYSGSWVPGSRLQHVITVERASEEYVRDYFVGQGRALVAKGRPWTTSRRKLFWHLAYELACYRFQRHWAKSPAWVAHLIRSGLAEGQYSAI